MLTKAAIKYIQSLQQKKFRDETGLFVAEGPKLVLDLIASGEFELKQLFALETWAETHILQRFDHLSYDLKIVTESELQKIAQLVTPNQVVAVFAKKPVIRDFEQRGITLILDHIQDPGNLGTIIRSADWFGIQNIVCSTHTVDMYSSKVVQSTMASIARVNVVYTDLQLWMEEECKLPLFAATLQGTSVFETGCLSDCGLIIGNESKGVSSALLGPMVSQISIPGSGKAESLNAAVAAAILLFHFSRPII